MQQETTNLEILSLSKTLRKIVMLGSGGHAAALFDILQQNNETIDLIVAPHIPRERMIFKGIDVISDNEFTKTNHPNDVILINGIGMFPYSLRREHIYTEYTTLGYQFKSIISKHAIISSSITLGEGVQILPGTIIQIGVHIGDNSILNTRSVVEHDCTIGKHNHIAPGAILCGGVSTGTSTFIGAGAVITQNIRIGEKTIIGAGTVITKDIASHHIVYPSNKSHY